MTAELNHSVSADYNSSGSAGNCKPPTKAVPLCPTAVASSRRTSWRHLLLTAVFDTKQSTAELNHSLSADSYVSNKPKHASLGSTPRASETSLALAASLSCQMLPLSLARPSHPTSASISRQVNNKQMSHLRRLSGTPAHVPASFPTSKESSPSLPAHLKANFVPAPKPRSRTLLQSIPHLVRHHSSGQPEGRGGRCHHWRVKIAYKQKNESNAKHVWGAGLERGRGGGG